MSHRESESKEPTAKKSPDGHHATEVIACSKGLDTKSARPNESHTWKKKKKDKHISAPKRIPYMEEKGKRQAYKTSLPYQPTTNSHKTDRQKAKGKERKAVFMVAIRVLAHNKKKVLEKRDRASERKSDIDKDREIERVK